MDSASASSPSCLVRAHAAGVKRDGRWLVRGVDVAVHRGEIVTLIGPNGSGKSTTAKMMVGITRPDEGRIERAAGLRIGYVPQRLAVDWTLPLTVRRLMRLTASLTDRQVAARLGEVGIGHLSDAEVRHLSGGELQRALLARAIAREPDLLVLDEPVQGVDFGGAVALYQLIADVRERLGCGVLLVSHDLHVVMAATDMVVCLNGHVCCRGTPETVTGSAEYRQMFGDHARSTLAVYRHRHDHRHLPDGRVEHADGSITDPCRPDDGHHHHPEPGEVGKPHGGERNSGGADV